MPEEALYCPFTRQLCTDGTFKVEGSDVKLKCRMWITIQEAQMTQFGTQKVTERSTCALADKTPMVVPIPVMPKR